MSWTAGILFVSWFCIVSVTEAALGTSCNETADPSNCAATESCTNSICVCSNGYFDVSGKCESNSISVTLQADSTSIVYGSSVVLTATITSAVPVDTVKWQKEEMNIDINQEKYTQSNVVSNKITLTIMYLVTNDGGSYRVQVNNFAGITSSWSTPVTLTVTGVVPTVTVPGKITETDTTVTIDCTASVSQGSPALTAVYWLLNGANLTSSQSNKYSGGNLNTKSLTINSIGPTDAGEYRCVATNFVGSTNSLQSVTLAPPSDVHISTSQFVDPIYIGSSITITGSFTSNLRTENKWQKLIGAELTDIDITDERYAGSSLASPTPKLVITKVDLIDRTSFRLVVTNRVGFNQSESITLNVVDGSISVTLTPPSISVKYGEDVTLTATIESPATVTNIKWQKVSGGSASDLDINLDKYTQTDSGPGTVTLMIKNVEFTDSGNYRVQVSNAAGTTKTSNQVSLNVKALEFNDNCTNTVSCNSSIHLECSNKKCLCVSNYYHKEQVCYADSISVTLQADSNSIFYGSSVVLTATITSAVPVDTVIWQKEEMNIDITQEKYTQSNVESNKITLTITNLVTNDGGSYRVQVNNSAGIISGWSTPVTLTVTGVKPTVTVPGTITETDTTVTIDCTSSVSQGSPALTAVYWLLNGANLSSSESNKYSGGNLNTQSLTINSIGPTDAGEYRCVATNLVGSTNSLQSVTLAPPSDVHISTSQSVDPIYIGSSITITGSFTSKLHTENKWQKQIGAEFTDIDITDGRYAGSSLASPTPKLVITKVDLIDGTSFKFVVTNRVGFNQSESITLNVVDGSISVTLTPPSISVKYGEDVTLTATIESPATVTNIKWQKVSGGSASDLDINLDKYTQTDSGSGTVTLMIKNVEFTDSGNYRVQVSNAAGTIKTSNQVSLNVKALEFNDNCTNTVSCNSSIHLECSNKKCLCVSNYYHKEQLCYAMSSAPTNLAIDEIRSRGFIIIFNRPDNVNGFLAAYKIVISEGGNCVQQILVLGHCSICMSTDGCPPPINYTVPNITNYDVSYTADGLDPCTHYLVKVVAINGKGEGHPVNKTVWTDEEVPLQPRQITASNVQSSSLTLAWTLPDPSPGNTTYTIYIYEGTDDVGSNFLMKDSTKVYGFETKMLSVTGLKEYWPYKFQVNAATEKGNRTSDFSSVFKTKLAVIKNDETTSKSSIIGSIVAVVLVVAVVVIGIFIWKRNRRHKEYKEQAITYADLNLDERTKVDQPYSLLEHGRTVKNKSVPLNSFYDNVVDLLNNNRQKLTKEYYDLLQDTERSASTAATSKNNISKNRGNIIPYDFNRVKLCLPGASDYIDASVMLDKCYILTSYPIAKTFGIFWQMIWEQSVSTIVVITEQNDARESWYFSDNEGTVRTIERINVELLAKFQSSESVTMRKIKLSRGKHSKVVNHFHVISLEMTDLPDQILALINTVTQNNVKNIGPQVVHGECTGIDNSGVYIAVDHAVKSVVSGGNEIDVYGTARTVMKERMFSISSLEQYSAIYTCLQKYVQNSPACKNDATGAYEYLP
ncbi:titin-like [Crassostrea angulata]|uniref:titin-like n=1 Tax=Magallana angulata TaxID=2784310 RepID=UPI0022B0DC97|nr:titin-like [Crassostrea angulata]